MSGFAVGDLVEFLSAAGWKPGVVAGAVEYGATVGGGNRTGQRFIRIHVGNGVHVSRNPEECRHADTGAESPGT